MPIYNSKQCKIVALSDAVTPSTRCVGIYQFCPFVRVVRSTFGNDCILSSFFSFILTSNKIEYMWYMLWLFGSATSTLHHVRLYNLSKWFLMQWHQWQQSGCDLAHSGSLQCSSSMYTVHFDENFKLWDPQRICHGDSSLMRTFNSFF